MSRQNQSRHSFRKSAGLNYWNPRFKDCETAGFKLASSKKICNHEKYKKFNPAAVWCKYCGKKI